MTVKTQQGHAKSLADAVFQSVTKFVRECEADTLKRVVALERRNAELEQRVEQAVRRAENADLSLADCQRMLCAYTRAKNMGQLRQMLGVPE